MPLIFVYGTLKRGGANHRFLADQHFVATAQTQPGFRLYNVGGYPGMVAASDEPNGIAGEVWRIDDHGLARLDEFEGIDEGLYRRESVALQPPFEEEPIQAYLYARDVAGRPMIGTVWPT